MKKLVKRYGSSLIIVIDKEDQEVYGIDEGDIIEMSDIVIIKKEGKK